MLQRIPSGKCLRSTVCWQKWGISAALFGGLVLAVYAGCFLQSPESSAVRADEKARKATAPKPVILLTGFEPFGPGRPANPSWEGIKGLDGKEWNGCKLVCKELKVEWGAPLGQLRSAIKKHKPIAIFSFGQGMPGAFAVESRASNIRRGAPDNRGEPPQSHTIVEGGEGLVAATAPFAKIARALSQKGYRIRISADAGRYLCEETLYTLEHLKSSKEFDGTVMFCHVPPLGDQIGENQITADYVQQFVKDLLESWKGTDPDIHRRAEVQELITRYFASWSSQDMPGYEECFLPDASIQHLNAGGQLASLGREAFIATQREYHRTATHRTVETPEKIDIRFEQKLARAVVAWKLTSGPRTETGYDHFTLVKHEGKWRIVNLVFYSTE